MAFLNSEKQQIRQFLGFSELWHDIDTRLESQIDRIGAAADQAAHDRIVIILGKLNDIDDRVDSALDNLTLQRAEDVTFRGEEELMGLRKQGRILVQQMSIIFEVAPMRDYYGMENASGGMISIG